MKKEELTKLSDDELILLRHWVRMEIKGRNMTNTFVRVLK